MGVFDARSRRSVAGSAGLASSELAEGFVRKGQRLIVQACRARGAAPSARLSVDVLALRTGRAATRGRTARAAAAANRTQVVEVSTPTRAPDDWSGEVRFRSPTPTTIGTKEAWTFTCRPPTGGAVTRQVTVDRGQSVDLGNACKR